jgi:hypothetical protein
MFMQFGPYNNFNFSPDFDVLFILVLDLEFMQLVPQLTIELSISSFISTD